VTKDKSGGRYLPGQIGWAQWTPRSQARMSGFDLRPDIGKRLARIKFRHILSEDPAQRSGQVVLSMRSPQCSSKHGAPQSSRRGLQIFVASRIRHVPPVTHRVGRSAGRASVEAARCNHGNVQGVTNLETSLVQNRREGAVLSQRLAGHSANGFIGRQLHGQARARRHPMVRPRIVRPWIATRVDLRYQSQVGIFQAPTGEKNRTVRNDLDRFGVDVARDAIRAGIEMGQIIGEPGYADHAVGIGR
jgi:hypothetical protein